MSDDNHEINSGYNPSWASISSDTAPNTPSEPSPKPPLGLFTDKALQLAQLVKDKREAYGDSFGRTEKLFHILYPDGVPTEQFKNALFILRVLDKICRLANNGDSDPMNEDPVVDIAGYALVKLVQG